ncbi:MAG: hypothetical protein ABJA82_13040 [Myxococcales bacterium]
MIAARCRPTARLPVAGGYAHSTAAPSVFLTLLAGLAFLGTSLFMASGCSTTPRSRERSLGGLDARYVVGQRWVARGAVTTSVYRAILAASLYSRCQMFPSDSRLYDQRAAACGGAAATLFGVSRLYLETGASPAVLTATFAEGRLRWLDQPRHGTLCSP